jgi:SOS-response transcriptional repressor LexA
VIGKNLRKIRGKKSLFVIRRDLGISDRYLGLIERGKHNPSIEILEKLAKHYGVPIESFWGVKEKPPVQYTIQIGKTSKVQEPSESYSPVPLLKDSASLGPGLEINESNIEGTVLIHSSKLKSAGEYQAIYVKGDSMLPELKAGDIVAIDVKQRNPESLKGKLIACHTGDFEVSIKKLIINKGGFWFKAVNSKWEEEQGPMLVPKKDGLILGKVMWAWKEY